MVEQRKQAISIRLGASDFLVKQIFRRRLLRAVQKSGPPTTEYHGKIETRPVIFAGRRFQRTAMLNFGHRFPFQIVES